MLTPRPATARKSSKASQSLGRAVSRNAQAQREKEPSDAEEDFAKLLKKEYNGAVKDGKAALTEIAMRYYDVDRKTASRFAGQIHKALLQEKKSLEKNPDGVDLDKLEKKLQLLLRDPPLYRNRSSRNEKPTEFYRRVWHEFAANGLLFQHELRAIDEQLINRIRHYCAVNHMKAGNFLPPPQIEKTKRDAALGDPQAIARLVATERQRGLRPK
jgi:hypothetical protein